MKNSSLGTKCLLAAVTLAVLAYFGIQGVRYFGDPLTTTLAYAYQVEDAVSVSGYMIRDEQLLPNEADGLLQLKRTEGEKISRGGVVATLYANQASLDRQTEIDAVRMRLEQLQYAQEAALGSEVSLKLDAQIVQNLLRLRGELAADRLDRAEDPGASLRSLVLKRDYTYTATEDLTAQISDLQAQLKSLRAQAASSTRRITAPVPGIYSAVVDGYEQVLTPAALGELTPSALTAVRADKTVQSAVGKLVLGDRWYYAAIMDEETAAALQEGGALTLRFAKSVERDLDVQVERISAPENGRVTVVFRGDAYLSELTLLRQQSAEILRSSTAGFRVPKEALRAANTLVDASGQRTKKEGTGLYCVVGMEARFKPVEVLYSGDGFVLVRSTATTDQESIRLRAGDEVILSAKNLYDGKVVG